MKFTAIVVIVYGLMVLTGGLIGYLTAGSLPSLIAGTVCGAAIFASGMGLFRSSLIAYLTACAFTAFLLLFFGIRYYQTLNMTPSGIMVGFSFIVLALLLTTRGKPARKS